MVLLIAENFAIGAVRLISQAASRSRVGLSDFVWVPTRGTYEQSDRSER